MAGLRIGQLARVIRLCGGDPPVLGQVGRIVESVPHRQVGTLYGLDIARILDTRSGRTGFIRGWAPFQLEPIDPDGMRPATWADMEGLWTPDRLREPVASERQNARQNSVSDRSTWSGGGWAAPVRVMPAAAHYARARANP